MKNSFVQDAIRAYQTRDVEGFEAILARPELTMQPKTIQRQIRNMNENIRNPIPEPKNTNNGLSDSTLKAASRAFKRRIRSKRFTPNGAFLQDKRATVQHPNRNASREYNFMHHATKGYRLRSVFRTAAENISRDTGFSALILPDVTDEESMQTVRDTYFSPPRLAVTKDNYLNRNGNIPGSIRRAGVNNV